MISGCQRYIVEVRDLGTFIRDIHKNQGVKIFTKYLHILYMFSAEIRVVPKRFAIKIVQNDRVARPFFLNIL